MLYQGVLASAQCITRSSCDQVNAVIEYLSKNQNSSEERFIFNYTDFSGAFMNHERIRFARPGEDGPAMAPPPYPCFSHPVLSNRHGTAVNTL